MKIAPSVLNANFLELGQEVAALEHPLVDTLHLDVMDGHFVPNLSFGPDVIRQLRAKTHLKMEAHLMVEQPETMLPWFFDTGLDRLLIHVESSCHTYQILQRLHEQHLEAGIVLNPGTAVSTVTSLLPLCDQVLVMTVNPGFGGQHFLPDMLVKVQQLKTWSEAHHHPLAIEVDGGINATTLSSVVAAGVNLAVVGTYIYQHHDYQHQLNLLQRVIEEVTDDHA